MGEATYYLMALFENEAAAQKALPRVRRFIIEGIRAEKWWQEHRGMENKDQRKEFWKQFKKKFPNVYEYMDSSKEIIKDGDCNNHLAAHLDFGFHEEEVEENLVIERNAIKYSAMVWHLAEWDTFAEYLRKIGTEHVKWASDEYVDMWQYMEVL